MSRRPRSAGRPAPLQTIRPTARLAEPGDQAECRALAAARGPEHGEELVLADHEVEPLQGQGAVREDLADPLEADQLAPRRRPGDAPLPLGDDRWLSHARRYHAGAAGAIEADPQGASRSIAPSGHAAAKSSPRRAGVKLSLTMAHQRVPVDGPCDPRNPCARTRRAAGSQGARDGRGEFRAVAWPGSKAKEGPERASSMADPQPRPAIPSDQVSEAIPAPHPGRSGRRGDPWSACSQM